MGGRDLRRFCIQTIPAVVLLNVDGSIILVGTGLTELRFCGLFSEPSAVEEKFQL